MTAKSRQAARKAAGTLPKVFERDAPAMPGLRPAQAVDLQAAGQLDGRPVAGLRAAEEGLGPLERAAAKEVILKLVQAVKDL